MSTPNDGGPAFPLADIEWHPERKHNNGMTLRDYFAAATVQGIWSGLGRYGLGHSGTHSEIAKEAYLQADAMLAERAKIKEANA